jgi:hypothetical protein
MVTTFEERISLAFWWLVGIGITTYLFLGVINTLMVVLN